MSKIKDSKFPESKNNFKERTEGKGNGKFNGGKFKKGKPRTKPSFNDFSNKDVVSSGPFHTNDPAWLDHNPQLTRAVSSLNFASRIGIEYELVPDSVTGMANANVLSPSLMIINYVPSIGISKDFTGTVNVAANQLSSYMRTKISGSRSYDPQDIMLYILAISSAYDFLNLGRRAYGIARYYNPWNVSTPRQYLTALGFDPDSILTNLATINAKLNSAALRLSTLHIPDSLKYVSRHDTLTSRLYSDSELLDRAQMYMFNPRIVYKYNETSGAGRLDPVDWRGEEPVIGFDDYYEILEDLIAAVLSSQDCWTIDGDFLKTFDSFYKLTELPLDTIIAPTYDKGIQSQLENMVMVGKMDDTTMSITQNVDGGYLAFDPHTYKSSNGAGLNNRILNFHWLDPTPLDIMYATELVNIPYRRGVSGSGQTETYEYWFKSLGSEIIEDVNMWNSRTTEETPVKFISDIDRWPTSDVLGPLNHARDLQNAMGILSFDWHPTLYWYMKYTDASDLTTFMDSGQIVDLDNWTVITREQLQQIHDVALLSYFNVPM